MSQVNLKKIKSARVIKPPNGVVETLDQKNKRLAAQWDTSCSFESTYDWLPELKKNFDITNLVDEIGEPVDHNIPDQADMCEIIRAAIYSGLFRPLTSDVTDIPFDALNYIDCPGVEIGVKICAVNGVSFYKKDMWTILLSPGIIQINEYPKFIKTGQNIPRYDIPDYAGEPVERKSIDAVMRLKSPSDVELQRLIERAVDFTKVDKTRPEDPLKRTSVKTSIFKKETIKSNQGWINFESGNVEVSQNIDFNIIGYLMISGHGMKSRLATRLVLDDVTQISTRMIQGYMDYPSITTAFVSQLQAGHHKISTQYRVSGNISLEPDVKDDENIVTGMIVIPKEGLFIKKVINPMEIQLFNDNNWTDFPTLSITVKLKKTAFAIVLYNFSMPGMQSHIVTRIDINTLPVFVINQSFYSNIIFLNLHYLIKIKIFIV